MLQISTGNFLLVNPCLHLLVVDFAIARRGSMHQCALVERGLWSGNRVSHLHLGAHSPMTSVGHGQQLTEFIPLTLPYPTFFSG